MGERSLHTREVGGSKPPAPIGRKPCKKLKPASYRLNGRATDKSGDKSALRRKRFRIVK